ncbi:MAG: hypothetical protein Q8R67_05105 [Rhodoferax sp.]|nr:hypothetical protein [Rhodoferax sp.]MDP3651044.1 hypothetical protein [Rhodoferax sp.]
MTIPTLSPAPATTPNVYGGDPAAFDAAMQAWLTWEAARSTEDPAFLAWIQANATTIAALASAAQSDRVTCQTAAAAVAAQSPVTNAAAAAASAAAAAVSASQAQATNPDSPIRLNPRKITADFTVAAAYNAASVGPIAIADGVTVTVQDNATWSIH